MLSKWNYNTPLYFHLMLPLFIPTSFSYSLLCSYSYLLLHFLSNPLPFPTSPLRSLTPPVTRLSPCHPVASCLSGAVGVEVRRCTQGRGTALVFSACLCNRRRRLSGSLSADQHRCRWEVKSSPVTRRSAAPRPPLNLPPALLCTLLSRLASIPFSLPPALPLFLPEALFPFVIAAARMEWALTKCRD